MELMLVLIVGAFVVWTWPKRKRWAGANLQMSDAWMRDHVYRTGATRGLPADKYWL